MEIRIFKNRKFHVSEINLYLYIFSIILTESTMYGVLQNLQGIGITAFSFQVISLVVGSFTMLELVILKGLKLSKNKIRALVVLFVYLLIYGLFNINKITSFFAGVFIPFFIACFVVGFYESKKIFEKFFSIYSDIVTFLACISLVFYIFGTLLHLVPGIPMMFTNNGWWYEGTNYYFLSFINSWQTIKVFGITIIRNVGIFMEAPGYAMILQYAFWWEVLGNDNMDKRRVIILLITMVTTFSAKAYVATAIIIFMYLYSDQVTLSKKWKRIRNGLLPITVLVFAVLAFNVVVTRNISVTGETSSLATRINDYSAAYKAWLDSPLIGCGFYNLEKLYLYYPTIRRSGTSTAGILNVFAYGGIYMAAFYLIAFIKYMQHNIYKENRYRIFSFLILVLFSFITGDVQYSYLMIFFMAFGYML